MPNRFSKAFRRRSSGGSNVFQYEEGPAATEQGTFRVLRRSQTDGPAALDGPVTPTNAPPYLKPDSRPRSYGDGSDASYKGSGNTNHSSSTAANHRNSYASTNPSSVDVHDGPPLPPHSFAHKFMNQYPPPPVPEHEERAAPRSSFSLKNAGRAFSFGNRGTKQNAAEAKQHRERALTTSSYASTTTPPKLDLGESNIGTGASDFGDLFGARNASTIMEEAPPVPPLPPNAQSQHFAGNDFAPPRRPSSPSGYSWTSNASAEKLMTSPRNQNGTGYAAGESPHFLSQFGGDSDSQLLLESIYGGGSASGFDPQKSSAPQPPRHIPDRTIQRPRAPPSAFSGPRNFPPPRQSPSAFQSRADDGFSSVPLTSTRSPPAQDGDDEPLFDAPRVRRPYRPLGREATMTKRVTRNKVMTPAEYEEAKQRRDLGIKDDQDEASSSSESEAYEDEDETEKTKNIARQRRRQEAQLTVYRQQMMKVTGEQPADLPEMNLNRPMPLQRSANSAPNMLGAMPWEGKDKDGQGQNSAAGKSSDEDEDEDVPLGVLQAHGFPNKGARPPTRVSSNGLQSVSDSNLLRSYPSPAGATRNEPAAGGGGNPNLPVFAKNLPQDPYVGANLVNSGRREAMGMSGDATPPKGVPPGGLVGVIAGEERARALRRGSPNTGGTFDAVPPTQLPMEMQEQMMRQQMMTAGRAEQQSQAQVNNSMMQMMQVQMQWMQQMMQMQGMQMPPMPMMPGLGGSLPGSMPGTPGGMPLQANGYMDPHMRPLSQASFGGHYRDVSHASARGPTPSAFGGAGASSAPSFFGMQGPGPGYTPSIAPSERSVAGQPSRYRPVTPSGQAPVTPNSRASTMSAHTIQPGVGLRNQRSQSRLRTESTDDLRKSTITLGSSNGGERPTIKAVNRPKNGKATFEDEDEDEAWADMARKRDARKSKWRKQPTDHDSSFASSQEGLEGLYYEGPS